MTESELLGAYLQSVEVINGNFEFWLTVTFAILITLHFAGDRIPQRLRRLIVGLYVAATALFSVRLFTAGIAFASIRDQLLLLDTKIHVVGSLTDALIGLLFLVIMLGGTLGTLLYVKSSSKGGYSVG